MDPNETLWIIRVLCDEAVNRPLEPVEVESLVEHFNALDQWLSKGGFPPADWRS